MNKGSTITTEKSFFLRRDINPWKGKYPVQVFVLGNIFIIFLSLRTKNLTFLLIRSGVVHLSFLIVKSF